MYKQQLINPHNTPVRQVLLSPFHRWGWCDFGRSSDLSRAKQSAMELISSWLTATVQCTCSAYYCILLCKWPWKLEAQSNPQI